MFDALLETRLADNHRLLPVDLPGFGAPPLHGETTLASLASFLADKAENTGADVIVAHSVASIVASLAVQDPGCPAKTILSLEGNLTPEDAYFSGTAATYDSPEAFRSAFLTRLEEMAKDDPIIGRYHDAVGRADPQSLWHLGNDAHHFSNAHHPGEMLLGAADVTYLFNPSNCPKTSIDWLEKSQMPRVVIENASHWPSVDQPHRLAEALSNTLGST